MAINKVTQPDPTTPVVFGDFTQQNEIAKANSVGLAPAATIVKGFASTTAPVVIAQGAYIYQAGEVYVVQSSDEPITGTISAGLNYIILTVSGSTLTASWGTSFSGYTFDEAYQGWYSGTTQILPQGIYLDGTTYNRIKANVTSSPFEFMQGDGVLLRNDTAIKNVSGTLLTGGDNIDTGSGHIKTTAGYIETGGGTIYTSGGRLNTSGGNIESWAGDIYSISGNIYSTAGDIYATAGNIYATAGYLVLKTVLNGGLSALTGMTLGACVLYEGSAGSGDYALYMYDGASWQAA